VGHGSPAGHSAGRGGGGRDRLPAAAARGVAPADVHARGRPRAGGAGGGRRQEAAAAGRVAEAAGAAGARAAAAVEGAERRAVEAGGRAPAVEAGVGWASALLDAATFRVMYVVEAVVLGLALSCFFCCCGCQI